MASWRVGFPDAVDEVTVRLVAGVVLVVGLVALLTGWWPLYAVLATDFVLRALFGPGRSPIAQFVLRMVRPRVNAAPRPTAGPPKRFAATIGAVMTVAATLLGGVAAATGSTAAATAVFAIGSIMVVFPALEAFAALCVGCVIFAQLIRLGIVPERICLECADITDRLAARLREDVAAA
ncbi:MAG: DUF4395 domain-containing protein [Actinomycetales bacterium]|jgi:hypothetical protein|nr:DUF4395 domain-containing protein [Actinomycetales bacterium]HMT33092.1 DUF4395 domain-containing protein [Dermatophilaceae bacterium]